MVKATPILFVSFLALSAVVYLVFPDAMSWYGDVAQLVSLVIAATCTFQAQSAYKRDDAPRSAWLLITLGLWVWVIAQMLETYCDVILKMVSYGTIADAFWCIGFVPLVLGVRRLVQNYRASGLPMGSRAASLLQAVFFAGLYFLVFFVYVLPQVSSPDRSIVMKFLDVYYSGMDFIIVYLCTLLIRVSWMMRGGSLGRSWIYLCLGFILFGAGDLRLSYATDINSLFYRLNDVMYSCANFLVALAGMHQVRMLKSK